MKNTTIYTQGQNVRLFDNSMQLAGQYQIAKVSWCDDADEYIYEIERDGESIGCFYESYLTSVAIKEQHHFPINGIWF